MVTVLSSKSIRENGITFKVNWDTPLSEPIPKYSEEEFIYEAYLDGVYLGKCTEPKLVEDFTEVRNNKENSDE